MLALVVSKKLALMLALAVSEKRQRWRLCVDGSVEASGLALIDDSLDLRRLILAR